MTILVMMDAHHEDRDDDDYDDSVGADDDDDQFFCPHHRGIVHDGADVVGQGDVEKVLIELASRLVRNIFLVHDYCFVSVLTLMFMPQTKGVSDLVRWSLYKTTLHERTLLLEGTPMLCMLSLLFFTMRLQFINCYIK